MLSPSNHSRICTAALTAAMIVVLTVSALRPVPASVEFVTMSPLSEMLNRFAKSAAQSARASEARIYVNHETDDLGYPMCGCADCREVSARMNTSFILQVFAGHHDPDRLPLFSDLHGEQDYDGDMGREHSDHMRDNGKGARSATVAGTFIQIADALPVIEAPGIVPDQPEQISGDRTDVRADKTPT